MSKEVQISIKMESESGDRFLVVGSAAMERPAAQLVRELTRAFISPQELPNADAIAAIEALECVEMTTYDSVDELYDRIFKCVD